MGKLLKVVVVGSSQNDALRVAADLEQCGFDPSWSLVSSEAEVGDALELPGRASPNSTLATRLPANTGRLATSLPFSTARVVQSGANPTSSLAAT